MEEAGSYLHKLPALKGKTKPEHDERLNIPATTFKDRVRLEAQHRCKDLGVMFTSDLSRPIAFFSPLVHCEQLLLASKQTTSLSVFNSRFIFT